MDFRFSRHAKEEMKRRSIPVALAEVVVRSPQQIVPASGDNHAYQSLVDFGGGKMFLLRAIVDNRVDPAIVVTVYRTSKVAKYWSTI
jgi:hypothetical protein